MTKKKKILICDDNPDFLQSFRMLIEKKFAVEVITFNNGQAVFRYLTEVKELPNLLILDLLLPDLDGDDLIQRFRSQEKLKDIPMILMSGIIVNVDNRANAIGADTYLRKPVSVKDLVEKVKKYIDPSNPLEL